MTGLDLNMARALYRIHDGDPVVAFTPAGRRDPLIEVCRLVHRLTVANPRPNIAFAVPDAAARKSLVRKLRNRFGKLAAQVEVFHSGYFPSRFYVSNRLGRVFVLELDSDGNRPGVDLLVADWDPAQEATWLEWVSFHQALLINLPTGETAPLSSEDADRASSREARRTRWGPAPIEVILAGSP